MDWKRRCDQQDNWSLQLKGPVEDQLDEDDEDRTLNLNIVGGGGSSPPPWTHMYMLAAGLNIKFLIRGLNNNK